MLYADIHRQRLKLVNEHVVADTIDYLEMKFNFRTDDWNGLTKWAHFANGDTVYDIPLTGDCIRKEDHLNLTAGEWRVYLHGNEFADGKVIERITTCVENLRVYPTGSLTGEPFPEMPASVTEQILARLDDIEQNGGGGVKNVSLLTYSGASGLYRVLQITLENGTVLKTEFPPFAVVSDMVVIHDFDPTETHTGDTDTSIVSGLGGWISPSIGRVWVNKGTKRIFVLTDKGYDSSAGYYFTWEPVGTENEMSGATSDTAGTAGLVPAPPADAGNLFLAGDGTWKKPFEFDLDVDAPTTNAPGQSGSALVPIEGTDKYAALSIVDGILVAKEV